MHVLAVNSVSTLLNHLTEQLQNTPSLADIQRWLRAADDGDDGGGEEEPAPTPPAAIVVESTQNAVSAAHVDVLGPK